MLKQQKQFFLHVALTIFLLILPRYISMEHEGVYYGLIVVVLALLFLRNKLGWDKKMDQRFLTRWKKNQNKSIWWVWFHETLRSMVLMLVVVFLGQYIGEGHTPWYIFNVLTKTALLKLGILFLVINVIIGLVAWHENEKKYRKLHD